MTRTEKILIGVVFAATLAAGAAHYGDASDVLAFVLAAIALAALAWLVSMATEQVGERFGPAVTGVMQSTLGNLPEFFIVLFALSAGQVVVAETSIIGSIFANGLLVLGVVIIVGARRGNGTMTFSKRLPQDTATLMLVAVFIIVIVGLAVTSGGKADDHIEAISLAGAVALLVVYLVWVWDYMRGEPQPGAPSAPHHAAGETSPRVPLPVSIALLAVAGVGAAFVSDWFIDELEPAIEAIGISEAFAGLVVVAIAGNAVENVVGVVLANKGESDFAISVVKNSVAQIAAFLYPALVITSQLFDTHLTFELEPVYIGALLLSALAIWQVTGDGEAKPFEGFALIALYVVLGAFALAS